VSKSESVFLCVSLSVEIEVKILSFAQSTSSDACVREFCSLTHLLRKMRSVRSYGVEMCGYERKNDGERDFISLSIGDLDDGKEGNKILTRVTKEYILPERVRERERKR